MKSFFHHLHLYEKSVTYNFLFFDQGTFERENAIKQFKLKNVFLFNPSGYVYSFKVFFSYLYTEYIPLLAEDWVVDMNVEKEIIYPSFLLELMYILLKVSKVYGILLRESDHFIIDDNITVKTKMGNHILYFGIMKLKYAFTNGATIYRTKNLREIGNYESEPEVSDLILKKGYKLGFTFKGRKGNKDDIFYQHVMDHIGIKTTRSSICTIPLY